MREQLRTQPALAHSRLAHQRHQLARGLLSSTLERPDQKRLLELATDERRGERAGHVRPETGLRAQRAPERQRLRLALHRHRCQLLPLEDAFRGSIGRVRDHGGADRRSALQPRRRVHDVAGHECLTELGPRADGDHRLARIDPQPHLQRQRRSDLVQLLDRLEDPQPGTHRAFGVVLVGDRRAEDGHDRVAHELLDGSAVALEHVPHPFVVGPQPRLHVLRIRLFRGRRETHEVAEQDGHDLPLLKRRPRRRRKRGPAGGAELKVPFHLPAAGRALRHRQSLGLHC